MTFEIDLNPHSFVVFMTIAAGVSYIFFNSRTGFGVVKLMTILFFVIPMLMIGNSLGHSVDLIFGTGIGILTARRLTLFNPFIRIRDYFGLRRAINKLNERLKENEERSQYQNQDHSAQEEAAKRQEQAKQERERKRQSNNKQGSSKQNSGGSSSNSNHQNSSSSSGQSEQRPRVDTKLVSALAVLGLAECNSYPEAKNAYRRLCKEFHPDAQAGASESVKKLAEQKMKEINVAWSFVAKSLKETSK